jgi:replicative DNA helicase
MQLSAPIHVLKSKAKKLKKEQGLSLNEALNQIAKGEGFNSWSLLQSKSEELLPNSIKELLEFYRPGDLVLLGARPGKGKTNFSISQLVMSVNRKKGKCFYFSLAEIHKDIAGRIASYDESIGGDNPYLSLDYSNEICAEYIVKTTRDHVEAGSLIVVDYLQQLDEKRTHPDLQTQLEQLHLFAKESGAIIIFLSQLDRTLEQHHDQKPGKEHIRMPNPFDLKLFNKVVLLFRKEDDPNKVEVILDKKERPHSFYVHWEPETKKFSDLI